jgi:L-lysine 6-transaminase
LVSGGSLAVENALKAAIDWKVRKSAFRPPLLQPRTLVLPILTDIAAGRGERGQKIIHFKEAFHGRSGYSLSLTNTDPRKYLYYPLFKDWPRVENPKALWPLEGENLQKTIEAETRSLTHIKAILEAEAVEIAAIILEPVQGEGGDHHFRPEFWQALRKLADDYEVMLIADEVQAGMGLTGKVWSWQHYGAAPDLMTFGKKAQVCGFMATARIDEVKDNVFQLPSRINSTWGGSLVDMMRSRKILEIIEEEKLVQNAATVGQHMLDKLTELSKKYPDRMMNVRGKGFMAAFNLPSPQHCNQLKALAYERGALIISCGTRGDVIRLRPVLDTKIEDIDKLVRILDECFEVMGPVSLLPKDAKH